jgi:cytoskeletal protein CcmA (bactofilin family)
MTPFTKDESLRADLASETAYLPSMAAKSALAAPAEMAVTSWLQLARANEAPNHLARGCIISGKLYLLGPALIEGEIDGEITSQDTIIIGKSAVVSAPIKAASITVAGKVTGNLIASQRIEIQSSANVLGNLISPLVAIHDGAVFNGSFVMKSE